MCNHWTTVSEIFVHLGSSKHRLGYLFRYYKMYHRKAVEELDELARDRLLQKFSEQIWKHEGSGKCANRMRCILNKDAIARLWPDHENYIDHSWKIMDDDEDFTTMSLSRDTSSRPGPSFAMATPPPRQNPPTYGSSTTFPTFTIPTSTAPTPSIPTSAPTQWVQEQQQIPPKQVVVKVPVTIPEMPTQIPENKSEHTEIMKVSDVGKSGSTSGVQMIRKASIEQIRGEPAINVIKEKLATKVKEHEIPTELTAKKRDADDRNKKEDKGRATENEKDRVERSGRSSRDRDGGRRDRRRSRSRKRSRTRDRDKSRDRRDSEKKRDSVGEKRRRSRSRSRTRTSRPTRSKSPPPNTAIAAIVSTASPSIVVVDEEKQRADDLDKRTWEEKAANFLANIGAIDVNNRRAANLCIPSLAVEQTQSFSGGSFGLQQPQRDSDGIGPESGQVCGGRGPVVGVSLESRLAQVKSADLPPRQLNAFEAHRMMEQLENVGAQMLRPTQPELLSATQTPTRTPQRQEFARKKAESSSEMRKAIAAMVELQQEYETTGGNLTAESFFKICEEMGLPSVMENKMICEAAVEFRVDLQSAFPVVRRKQQMAAVSAGGIVHSPQTSAAPLLSTPAPASTSAVPFNLRSLGLNPEAMADILRKVDVGSDSQATYTRPTSSSGLMPNPSEELVKRLAMVSKANAEKNYLSGQQPEGHQWAGRNSGYNDLCSVGSERRQSETGNSWTAQVMPNIQPPSHQINYGRDVHINPGHEIHFNPAMNEGPVMPPLNHPQRVPPFAGEQQQQQMTQPMLPPQLLGNPDIQRLVQAVGDDWLSLGQFSNAMLAGLGLGLGEQQNQSQNPETPHSRR